MKGRLTTGEDLFGLDAAPRERFPDPRRRGPLTEEQAYRMSVERLAAELAHDHPGAARELRQMLAVELEADRIRVRDAARVAVSADGWVAPVEDGSLAEQLAEEDDGLAWLVEGLAFAGANVLITAEAKAGKTVLSLNVLRALVDGLPLFGHFDVRQIADGDSVAWWNAELTRTQAKSWLRDMHFQHPERVYPLHLRGVGVPLHARPVQDWAVRWLSERNVKVWILDPKSALFDGEENSATETGAWLKALDEIKLRAGVETLFLVHHASMGVNHDEEEGEAAAKLLRPRGSTRLVGWADVLWSYTGRNSEPRYLGAIGRDVDLEPFGGLRFSPGDRTLTWDGSALSPAATNLRARAELVYEAVQENPGLKTGALDARLPGSKPAFKRKWRAEAERLGWVVSTPGPRNSELWHVGERSPRRIVLSETRGSENQ